SDLQTSAGAYLDLYWFNGAQGDNVRINMNAVTTTLDPFLILNRNDGDPRITQDDNSGGGKNAQITNQLTSTGIYIIIATPLDPNVVGNYSVSLAKLAGFDAQDETDSGQNWILKTTGREIYDRRTIPIESIRSSLERSGTRRIVQR